MQAAVYDRWTKADRLVRGQGGHTALAANPARLSGHNTWPSLVPVFKERHAFFLTPLHTMVYTTVRWLFVLP
jgi:hypothetical protein